jgi:hypothetical protein
VSSGREEINKGMLLNERLVKIDKKRRYFGCMSVGRAGCRIDDWDQFYPKPSTKERKYV